MWISANESLDNGRDAAWGEWQPAAVQIADGVGSLDFFFLFTLLTSKSSKPMPSRLRIIPMSRGSTRNAYHGGEGPSWGSCEGRQRFETLLSEARVFSMKDLLWPTRQPPRTFLFRFFLDHFTLSIFSFFFFFLYIFVCVGRSIFKGRLGTGIYHSYNESRKIGPEEGLGGIIKLPLALGGTMNQTKHTPTTLLLLRCYDLFIMRARLLDSRVAVGGSLFCCRGPRSQKRVCLSSACS